MLTYAAILPHPPFIFESLGGDHAKQFAATRQALRSVGEDLASLALDAVVVITAHGERYEEALSIAQHDPYVASLRTYGELGMDTSFRSDQALIDRLQRTLRRRQFGVTLTTNERLDHGTSVPLIFLKEYIGQHRFVVCAPPVASPKRVVEFGDALHDAIADSGKRIGVLCTASLSHRLATVSPGGFHPEAQAFDDRIRTGLKDGNTLPFHTITQEEITEYGAGDFDAIRLFVGALGDVRHSMEERSYESPLGTGQLTMVAELH